MKEFEKIYKLGHYRSYVALLVACLTCLMIEPFITNLLFFVAVEIIDKFNQSWTIALFSVLTILLILYIALKYKRLQLYVEPKVISLALFIILFYSYYRFIDSTFSFWGWHRCGHCIIACTDGVLLLCLLPIVQKLIYRNKISKNKETSATKLLLDAPIADKDADLFGYDRIAKTMLKDLYATDVSIRSFTVGVLGEWGIGKSSFLNLLEKQIIENEDVVFRFYPRSSKDVQSIQTDFFNALSESLSPYHTGVWRIVNKYVKSLQSPNKGSWFDKSLALVNCISEKNEREHLQEIIHEIGRNVFVIIEDLDRLTAEEIIEVLKVTDRNANFPQTYFITAYDKNYVDHVLKNYLRYDLSQSFIDKYVDYEFLLPTHDEDTTSKFYEQYLEEQIVIQEGDYVNKDDLMNAWRSTEHDVILSLHSMRHVKRFLNILVYRMKEKKNEVNLVDFIFLTLLRYKDLKAYHLLAEKRLIHQGLSNGHNTYLYYLLPHKEIDALITVQISKDILSYLFPQNGDNIKFPENSYRRIRNVSSFEFYFFEKNEKTSNTELAFMFKTPSDEQALEKGGAMYKKDPEGVMDYILSFTFENYQQKEMVKRHLLLLIMLYTLSSSVKCKERVIAFFDLNFYAQAASKPLIKNIDEYVNLIDEILKLSTELYPKGLGLILTNALNSYTSSYVIKREKLVIRAFQCQKIYFKRADDEHWNLKDAFAISMIPKTVAANKSVIYEDATNQVLDFIKTHPRIVLEQSIMMEKSGENIVNNTITVCLNFYDWFIQAPFLKFLEGTFDDWVNKNIKEESAKRLFKQVYQMDNLTQKTFCVDKTDFETDSFKTIIKAHESSFIKG